MAALLPRVAAEFGPRPAHLWAGSAVAWIAAWLLWSAATLPRMRRLADRNLAASQGTPVSGPGGS